MNNLENWLDVTAQIIRPVQRPLVSLCYAQSLDGSLTLQRGKPLALSGNESMRLTHQLRSLHSAILIGIGTVLADDPQLTVRYAAGPTPQPIIMDSHLRFPQDARLWTSNPHRPWLVAQAPFNGPRQALLEARGARLIELRPGPSVQALPALLHDLWKLGIHSLMIEGGARIIESFLRERLVDRLIVTLAPCLVGGLHYLGEIGPLVPTMALDHLHYERLGNDLVVCALPSPAASK